MNAILLFGGGLLAILAGASLFTNAVEWLGKKLKLSQGMVGSVLAAVGTALPETMVPVVAILFSTGESHAREGVGIGAILGAPFMLGTLAMFVTGAAVYAFCTRRANGHRLAVDHDVMRRDLGFFLVAYPVALLASLVPAGLPRIAVAAGLAVAYFIYVLKTANSGDTMEDHEVSPLLLARPLSPRHAADPAVLTVVVQGAAALAFIVGGAHYFVEGLVVTAGAIGLPPLVLSLILTPVATELPEKLNSVLWVREGKDTLALGNITGAMAFQSSVIPAIGIALTSWKLDQVTVGSAVLALLSAGLMWTVARERRPVTASLLTFGGAFYLVYLAFVAFRI